MADYHDTTGEIFQGVFQRPHGVYVEIVRGLVQQKHIGAFFQYTGKMPPVPLSPGQRSHRFLLVCPGKIKARHVCAGIDLPAAKPDNVTSPRNYLPYSFLWIEGFSTLFAICEL